MKSPHEIAVLRRNFLEETVAFYRADPVRLRAKNILGKCVFSKTETSPGCALGRHIPYEDLKYDLDNDNGLIFNWTALFVAVPIFAILGKDFLEMVQYLHDTDNFWTTTNISMAGIRYMADIYKKFQLEDHHYDPKTGNLL